MTQKELKYLEDKSSREHTNDFDARNKYAILKEELLVRSIIKGHSEYSSQWTTLVSFFIGTLFGI